jgi:tetratricopeptide (TPR) repeat protein
LLVLSQAMRAEPVTFSRNIAPLVFTHCAPCHHAGGSAPFALLTYTDVAKHATQIAAVTRSRFMPPWPPQRGYGEFVGDRSLSDEQIALFAKWIEQGKPSGDQSVLPSVPRFSSEWQMGPPDLVLQMEKPYRVAGAGADVFRNFVISTGLNEVKYVRGLEVRPSNTRVVHHANLVLDRTRSLRVRDGEDGQPGFPGMDVITEAAAGSFDPDSHFLFWKPASVLRFEPADRAWRLDPGTDLILNLHLQPTGKDEEIQVQVGIYFAASPPARFPMLMQLEHDGAIRIPAGESSFVVTDSLTLPVDVDVLAIYPHAHYLGKLVEAWAVLPSGGRRRLIRIPDWDINWQATYEYKRPISLPKGTKIEMRIGYDNTAANPRNPNRPPKLVVTGNRSADEMGHVWLQVLPKSDSGDPRRALQEALMRRRLEKYPGDFLAQYNLAASLQSNGKTAEAIALYEQALAADPKNATAHNSLASALLMQDQTTEAITELREALRLDPGYLNAHYNLARALAASGELSAAAAEYSAFLARQPADADAQAGLGTVLFKQRGFVEALEHFRAAVRLNPDNADFEANLGTLLAITGNLPGAEQAFQTALRLDPQHAAARENLTKVQAQLRPKH